MTVKIELPEEQFAALKARAAARGLTLEDWLQKLVSQDTVKNRYTLAELMEQCDANTLLTAEDRAWLDAPPVGREAL